MAMKVAPRVATIYSDHLIFVREGNSWNRQLGGGTARHADIWRQILQLCEPDRAPPLFEWAPARRDIEEVMALEQGQ
eukprot:3355284-Pyramimonas_sp.AAC.1